MRISDWSSDVCSADLEPHHRPHLPGNASAGGHRDLPRRHRRGYLWRDLAAEGPELPDRELRVGHRHRRLPRARLHPRHQGQEALHRPQDQFDPGLTRSEEHTSELPSLMRISYAVFCLNKKIISQTRKTRIRNITNPTHY